MSRHRFADVLDVEAERRLPGNQRLGTVVFPNGSIAVLPPVGDLQAVVAIEAMRAAT